MFGHVLSLLVLWIAFDYGVLSIMAFVTGQPMIYLASASPHFSMGALFGILIGAAVVVILFLSGVTSAWRKKFGKDPTKEVKYKAETFRHPINSSITVAGLAIPIISGIFGYYVTAVDTTKLPDATLLVASLILLFFSLIAGVFLVYSLAVESLRDDTFTITKERNVGFPAMFVCQLVIFLMGVLLLLMFVVQGLFFPVK